MNTGAIVSNWAAVTTYPRLVPGPNGGIRLVFTGADGKGGSPFNNDSMYSATSGAAGHYLGAHEGSMSQSKLVPLTDDAAVNRANGTPVAGWSAGAAFAYHVGVDPDVASHGPDRSVSVGAGGDVVGPTMVRDKSGRILAAWFNASGQASQGYWVDADTAVYGAQGEGARFGREESRGEPAIPGRGIWLPGRGRRVPRLLRADQDHRVRATSTVAGRIDDGPRRAAVGDRPRVARGDRRGPERPPVDRLVRLRAEQDQAGPHQLGGDRLRERCGRSALRRASFSSTDSSWREARARSM